MIRFVIACILGKVYSFEKLKSSNMVDLEKIGIKGSCSYSFGKIYCQDGQIIKEQGDGSLVLYVLPDELRNFLKTT